MPYETVVEEKKLMLAAAQAGICPWCELPLPDDLTRAHLDHIIPRCRGGPNKGWNLQLLHERCNWGKQGKLTPKAQALAELHGIVLHEPLPTAWPGSTKKGGSGKLNPYRSAAKADRPKRPPPPPKVTIRKVYEVECHTCHAVIGAPGSWDAAREAKRVHMADHKERPAARPVFMVDSRGEAERRPAA